MLLQTTGPAGCLHFPQHKFTRPTCLATAARSTLGPPHLARRGRGSAAAQTSGRTSRCRTTQAATRTEGKIASNAGKELGPPFNVVITGSTKGVGKALAEEFVRQGDNVIISSRSDDRVASVARELSGLARSQGTGSKVKGVACNICKPSDVANLASQAADSLGSVDLWINNAGSNAYKYATLADSAEADLINIVETNVLGTMLGTREAIRVMRKQGSGGHIFVMDGAGADGNATPRFAAYGATKRSLAQFIKSLQAELKMQQISNVGIHNLSPGMVTTELLMSGADTQVAKFFINCLAEEPATVAQYLVPRIRQVPTTSKGLGGGGKALDIRFLTKPKAYSQILLRLIAQQRKNRWVQE
ncbi:hypothetical protein WJX74_001479 [Apatococcus lobatus]|uniref:Chlorophyll b reductase n=1 Tax=Apatococcus lobatus TaxID=904363 RepID=A0AAW1S0W1_9CHLO